MPTHWLFRAIHVRPRLLGGKRSFPTVQPWLHIHELARERRSEISDRGALAPIPSETRNNHRQLQLPWYANYKFGRRNCSRSAPKTTNCRQPSNRLENNSGQSTTSRNLLSCTHGSLAQTPASHPHHSHQITSLRRMFTC